MSSGGDLFCSVCVCYRPVCVEMVVNKCSCTFSYADLRWSSGSDGCGRVWRRDC